jgi:RNA polymerase sigma-70 factor, ECF subfamily
MWKTINPALYPSLSLTDLIYLCAGPCDEDAWREFVSRVDRPISLTVLRSAALWGDPSRTIVEDLVQTTYLKLWEDNCRRLLEFSLQHPHAILAYLKKVAANVTHDHFKHQRSQSSGGSEAHVSTADIDPEAGHDADGSQQQMDHAVFVQEIDDCLRRGLAGPDADRDRTIFWLYFRQGMSTKEIASLPTVGLTAKGVGSVLDRMKRVVRMQLLDSRLEDEKGETKSKFAEDLVMTYGVSELGTSTQ